MTNIFFAKTCEAQIQIISVNELATASEVAIEKSDFTKTFATY